MKMNLAILLVVLAVLCTVLSIFVQIPLWIAILLLCAAFLVYLAG